MGKKRAIVFDIDGTLAHMDGRKYRHGKAAPYLDYDAHDDRVDQFVKLFNHMVKQFGMHSILIVSGRKDSSYEVLYKWLNDNSIYYDHIYMRKHNDNRADYIIKKEIYENFLSPYYDIDIWVDDRQQVVDQMRHLGLKVFQVAEGNF